jgi:hypothetical protein
MIRERRLLLVPLALALVLGASLPTSAVAGGRGGGDSGDSSMNPFTGDSYAYFHNGHNLGEQGMILPGRVPAAKGASNDTAKTKTATAAAKDRTAAFQAPDARHGDASLESKRDVANSPASSR